MEHILEIKHLTKKIKSKTILKDINIKIKEQEIIGLVGPNGAGKSTLMKCIASIYLPTQGSIKILDKDVNHEHAQAMQSLGICIEQPALFPYLTGHDHFQLIAKYKKVSKEKIKELEEFSNLGDKLNDKTKTYSMGMKQRMALSLALMNDPKLIILDEPTNGLDPQSVFELRKQLLQIKEKGSSIVLSSHTLREIEKIADRIIFIDQGRVMKEIKTADIAQVNQIYTFFVSDVPIAIKVLNSLDDCKLIEQKEDSFTYCFVSNAAFSKALTALTKHTDILSIYHRDDGLESFYQTLYEGKSYD
ncbi:ABC transporter ATP-binding protein [[Eubacterium] hominis]|uniref:ABC transporter ATP-binding protein n=1 Tax=[Eubacterium] hominis TaxID=2764325 RepID=UPI003A4D8473